MNTIFEIVPGQLSLDDLRSIHRAPVQAKLSPGASDALRGSRACLEEAVAAGETLYGINTGFGRLAKTQIPQAEQIQLQRNLLLSHAAGVGEPLADPDVRLITVLKVASLARGYSGVRPQVVDCLLAMVNQEIYPLIPAQGSVGASGDLAPLAHLALPLIGEGRVRLRGEEMTSRQAFEQAGIERVQLMAKEGLALLNGTQVSTALALAGLFAAERNASAALATGAICVDAILGSLRPFDARVQAIRGHAGQGFAARGLREMLKGSHINASHSNCPEVQDPYSVRCQPQVMGACLAQLRFAAQTLAVEANAVTDNPLIFADSGDIVCGGNFHAEPVAFAADGIALAIAETGALAERRIALLTDAGLSRLPAFLARNPGVNSGFMIAQVTAASLASENKSLAHPASVDSLPTSANQEDHVSMATFAARRLYAMNANTRRILAIEWLAAAQGIEFRRPLQSSAAIEANVAALRQRVPPLHDDRLFAPDIAAADDLIAQGALGDYCWAFVTSGVSDRREFS